MDQPHDKWTAFHLRVMTIS